MADLKGAICGLGNPLLDISAHVDQAFLDKYQVLTDMLGRLPPQMQWSELARIAPRDSRQTLLMRRSSWRLRSWRSRTTSPCTRWAFPHASGAAVSYVGSMLAVQS